MATGLLVAKGVIFSSAGNTVLRFLDVGVAILLLRWLSIFEFGAYRLALAAYDFGTSFFLSGIENVVVSDVSGGLKTDKEKAKEIFTIYALFMMVIGVILWGIFYFGSDLLTRWVPEGVKYLKIISFLFLLAPIETAYKLKFQIFLDFGWAAVFKVLRDVFRLLTILSLFLFASFGIREALWSLVAAVALPVATAVLFYRRESLLTALHWREIPSVFSGLFFAHGKWGILDEFASNIGKNIRPFVIKFFAGTEAVAIYMVAQNLLSYTTSLFPLRDILTPVLSRDVSDRARLALQAKKAAKYATYAYALLGVAGAVGMPVIVWLFFPKYQPSLALYFVLILGLPWLGYRSVMNPVFYALREQRTLFVLTALRLAIITLFGVILVFLFGIWGAAFEFLLMNILLTPAFIRALKKALPEWNSSYRDLFVFDTYDKLAIAAIWSRVRQKARFF